MSKTEFYSKQHRDKYRLVCEVAKLIRADPSLLQRGRDWLEKHLKDNTHSQRYYRMWVGILDTMSADQVADLLEGDTPESDLIRDTSPVFVVLPNKLRTAILMNSMEECHD